MSILLDALKSTTTLVAATTSAPGLNRKDKNASAKVNNDHNAAINAGSVSVNRLAGADTLHKQIVSVQNKAGQIIKHYGQPFGTEPKWIMLPNVNFERTVGELANVDTEFKRLNAEMYDLAPDIVAAIKLGNYDVAPMTVEELRTGYKLVVEFRPIPESANFKGLSDSTIRKLQRLHDAKLEEAVLIAEKNTLSRFIEPLDKFIEGMAKYEEKLERKANDPDDKKRDGTFRDTLVSNIKDVWDIFDTMCVSGDPRFQELKAKLDPLANIDPKKLRDDDVIRTAATDRAKEVAENLKGWLS